MDATSGCKTCKSSLSSSMISSLYLCSGESMENALRACCKGIKIGKILIHREGDNGQQVCTYYALWFGIVIFYIYYVKEMFFTMFK